MNPASPLVDSGGVIDGGALRRALTALAQTHSESALRPAVRTLLDGTLKSSRAAQMAAFRDGGEGAPGGLATAQAMSRQTDELVTALYDFTTVHVFRSRNPTEGERFCVAAVGGFGRGELAPWSDLDLLFLRGWKQSAWEESVIEYMLYMLWDLGLKVGHAARSGDDCIKRARDDQQILTNLLDARRLAGDEALFDDLVRRLYREAIQGRERDYVGAKLVERDTRHSRAASRYMVEPDVKDGKGALRDLQTLEWIARALFPEKGVDALPGKGLLSEADRATHDRAKAFFWDVRMHLHDAAKRAQETLTFDFQPELAARMGYRDAEAAPAVEAFMRDYFRVATDVGALVRVACARLEALHAKSAPGGMSRFLPFVRARRPHNPAFAIASGRLTVTQPEAMESDPRLILDMFAEAARLGVDIHPDAMAHARALNGLIDDQVRADPRAAAALFTVLDSAAPEVALRLMAEAGVIEQFLPEFGRIVGRTQFNMYHAYTVDEHTLRAISVLARIREGKAADEHPLATEAFPEKQHHRALFLAMLLHDTGKTGGDQSIAGAASARSACTRLGLPEEEIELISWLVLHHLDMSDAAQTRDIGNPKTIADFTEMVGSMHRLRLLLCLTIADIKAVAPGVWTSFKAELLRELYRLTVTALEAQETEAVAAASHSLAHRASQARSTVRAMFGDDPYLATWGAEMEDSYWLSFEPEEIAKHVRFVGEARAAGKDIAVRASIDTRRGATELLVRAPDRIGLFADIARAIAVSGAEVADARLYTGAQGRAFDIFYLQNASGDPYGASAPRALAMLEDMVAEAAGGLPPADMPAPAPAPLRQAVFEIEPSVRLDDEASDLHTVVEAVGRNRHGLLSDLAAAITARKLSVASAHIETRGERVVDVFYVNEPDGGAVTDPGVRKALVDALMAVLSSGETDAEEALARRGMRRAPSSGLR